MWEYLQLFYIFLKHLIGRAMNIAIFAFMCTRAVWRLLGIQYSLVICFRRPIEIVKYILLKKLENTDSAIRENLLREKFKRKSIKTDITQ